MTISMHGALRDTHVDHAEAERMFAHARTRATSSLPPDPAQAPAAYQQLLKDQLIDEGMPPDRAERIAERVVDSYVHRGTGKMATVAFNQAEVQFPDSVAMGTSSKGFPTGAAAPDHVSRRGVYHAIAAREDQWFGNGPDGKPIHGWGTLGDEACGQVGQQIDTIASARAILPLLRSGNMVNIKEGVAQLLALIRNTPGLAGQMLRAALAQVGLTEATLGAMAAANPVVGAAGALAALLQAGGVSQAAETVLAGVDNRLGRLEVAFKRGNAAIFNSMSEAYDQYDRGGARAVTNPQLRAAFEKYDEARRTADPEARRRLVREGTVMIAEYEQRLVQPEFDQVADIMRDVPDIPWNPPAGSGASPSLGSGADWCDYDKRMARIRNQVAPAYGLGPNR